MLNQEEVKILRRMKSEGNTNTAIARTLNCHPNTVAKRLKTEEEEEIVFANRKYYRDGNRKYYHPDIRLMVFFHTFFEPIRICIEDQNMTMMSQSVQEC